MNKEQLEKHAVVDFSIRLTLQTDEKEKKTHSITRTLGNCPSFGSISFVKSLRHVPSRVCNSLKFFEASCLPIGDSHALGYRHSYWSESPLISQRADICRAIVPVPDG